MTDYTFDNYCENLQKEIKEGVEVDSIDYGACRRIILEDHFDDLISEMEFTDIIDNSTENRDTAIVYIAKFLFLGDESAKYESMDYVSNLINQAVKSLVDELKENYIEVYLSDKEESDPEKLRDFNTIEAAAINAEL